MPLFDGLRELASAMQSASSMNGTMSVFAATGSTEPHRNIQRYQGDGQRRPLRLCSLAPLLRQRLFDVATVYQIRDTPRPLVYQGCDNLSRCAKEPRIATRHCGFGQSVLRARLPDAAREIQDLYVSLSVCQTLLYQMRTALPSVCQVPGVIPRCTKEPRALPDIAVDQRGLSRMMMRPAMLQDLDLDDRGVCSCSLALLPVK